MGFAVIFERKLHFRAFVGIGLLVTELDGENLGRSGVPLLGLYARLILEGVDGRFLLRCGRNDLHRHSRHQQAATQPLQGHGDFAVGAERG